LLIQGKNFTIKLINLGEEKTLANQDGLFSYLNVGDEPLYVGGVPNSIKDRIVKQLSHVKNASSFHGCLTRLVINSELRDLQQQVEYSHKIAPGCLYKEACYESNNKCMNKAKCVSKFDLTTINVDFKCDCEDNFMGDLCQIKKIIEPPVALPLIGDSRPNSVLREKNQCGKNIVSEIYVDEKSGCKSKRKIKLVKCDGQCMNNEGENGLNKKSPSIKFRSIDYNKQPFSFIIGSNKKQLSLRSNRMAANNKCCSVSETRQKRMKLHCENGSVITTEVNLVKECSCSNKCQN
jgi:hypothetical protein